MKDKGCICQGNWRQIVKESEPFLDKAYVNKKGKKYYFFGVVHGNLDYYYGMYSRKHGMVLLSCVGSIEGHGFKLKKK
jgi:hypothetical protein